MASATAQRIKFEELRSLAFGSITGPYVGVGAPFANPVRLLKVTNLTDADLVISFNGITDQDIVSAHGGFVYDYASNKMDPANHLEQPVGDRIYVRVLTTLPTDGGVFVTVIYADNK